jgi:hypothetical protein
MGLNVSSEAGPGDMSVLLTWGYGGVPSFYFLA